MTLTLGQPLLELHRVFSIILVLTLITVVYWLFSVFIVYFTTSHMRAFKLCFWFDLLDIKKPTDPYRVYVQICSCLRKSFKCCMIWKCCGFCLFRPRSWTYFVLFLVSTCSHAPDHSPCLLLTLSDGVVAVAVGVVGHVSEQRVVGMWVFGAQAVSVCSCVCAAPPCEFAWKVTQQINISGRIKHTHTHKTKKTWTSDAVFGIFMLHANVFYWRNT